MSERIFFGVMVTPLRAAFLEHMLTEPLCKSCGREVAECEPDPCEARKAHEADQEQGIFDRYQGKPSHWDEVPGWPVEDWQIEVSSDDTRLGYHEWARSQQILAASDDDKLSPDTQQGG